ncbi:translation elongation factor Ts [Pseudomonadales bacterium]|jgi:elongation factor Ts|nr:translation elongation factor Ts [Pseudomonadales bacterium]MDA8965366.1 translation elongation factor Ts [Pseudomonadales bacterium]MDB4090398.1 translation elongation factor Ts [Pseudomonadales bacterium]MDB4806813.1 translation elongation factor Ts [Pseudomonadales bacterium]
MAEIKASMVKELRDRTGLGMMECKKALAGAGGDIDAAIEELRKSSGMKAAKKAGRTAAEGAIALQLADDGKSGVMVEVNSETDFAARDANFLGFVGSVVAEVAGQQQTDIAQLMSAGLEDKRQALVQKIGENITVRRAELVAGDVVGGYVHGNGKIAVLVNLIGGDAELAKDVAMHVAAVNPQVAKPSDMSPELLEKERAIYVAQAADSGKPPEIVEKMVEGRVRKFVAESSLVEQPFVKDPDLKVSQLLKNAGADVVGFVRFEVGEGIEKDEVDFASEVAAQVQQSS